MATLIFNHFAKNAKADSAGLMPSENVDPGIYTSLSEIGIDAPENLKPKKLTERMIEEADFIISFGCLDPQQFPGKNIQNWYIYPPRTPEEFRKVRDKLKEKILKFIAENNL
jgi:protein-tyrosine-phosphatase